MSIVESINKIYKPNTYNEVILDLIYGHCWRKAIEEELQNLKNYYTWEYKQLSNNRKAIGSK